MTSHEHSSQNTFVCPTCGNTRPLSHEVLGSSIDAHLLSLLREQYPEWDGEKTCKSDTRRCRVQALRELLEAERGEVTELDEVVLSRMASNQPIARNVEESPPTVGDRVADSVARFGGSWKFIGLFSALLLGWMTVNALMAMKAFDPYPFILLNLVLSSLAAVQAPFIMMSQNRTATKDRGRSEQDYQVNLKAELEVHLLNDKLDRIIHHEWPRLVRVQALQLELLEALSEPQSRPRR